VKSEREFVQKLAVGVLCVNLSALWKYFLTILPIEYTKTVHGSSVFRQNESVATPIKTKEEYVGMKLGLSHSENNLY
jgi:hypothetical protein